MLEIGWSIVYKIRWIAPGQLQDSGKFEIAEEKSGKFEIPEEVSRKFKISKKKMWEFEIFDEKSEKNL